MKISKLGIVVTHPIQYQAPLYRYLEAHSSIKPFVLFLTRHGVDESFDPGFGRSVKYDIPLLEGYDYKFLRNISPKKSPSTIIGAINPSLISEIRKHSFDAVLFHGWYSISNWLGFTTSRLSHIPYILRGETKPDQNEKTSPKLVLKHKAISPIVRNAAACLAIGSLNHQFYIDYGVPPSNIFKAPYSIDTDRFEQAGNKGRKERTERLLSIGLNPELPTIIYAAKLQPWKRPIDLIKAVDQLDYSVNLIIIGDGVLTSEITELAYDRQWMKVLGFVNQSEIGEWFGVADIFVLPSEHEPWGLVVNEAMSAGAIPIVSDKAGCGPDLVTTDTGYRYETGNIGALAMAIKNAIADGTNADKRFLCQLKSREYSISATANGIELAMTYITGK